MKGSKDDEGTRAFLISGEWTGEEKAQEDGIHAYKYLKGGHTEDGDRLFSGIKDQRQWAKN